MISSPVAKMSRGEEINKCYTCPKQLQVSLVSAEINVTKTIHISPMRGKTPPAPPKETANKGSACSVASSIDREAAREFIRKQQEQRKAMEIARKANNEKGLIKERLAALQKRTRNLVQHNVEKKKATKLKQSPPKMKKDVPKTPPKTVIPAKKSLLKEINKEIVAKEAKMEEKSPLKSKSQVDDVFLLPTIPSLGLLRHFALLQDDIYSPLKIHDATGVQESPGGTLEFGRPSYNQTYGNLTLDPNATSFIIHSPHENSKITNKSQQKETNECPKEEEKKPSEMPDWLQETNVQQYPYNFITALKKKLRAAAEEAQTPIPATNVKEKYNKMGLINEKREYESCSFTEMLSESDFVVAEKQEDVNTSVSTVSSPLGSKYEESEDTDVVVTVSDPNTISEVTSLQSETPEVLAKPEVNPIPSYDEFNAVRQKLTKNTNKYLLPSTKKTANEIALASGDEKLKKETTTQNNEKNDNLTSDKQQLYEKLLSEFQQSLNNFMELNQQLHAAVKTQRENIQQDLIPEVKLPSLDLKSKPPIQKSPVPTPTKYSSSFDSPANSVSVKNVVERQNSSSSNTTTTNTTGERKSDFYEPQRFEREFGGDSPATDNVVEEIESAPLTSSHSVPIIRETKEINKSATSLKKNIDSGTSSLKEDADTLQSSEKQSTSAGNDESSVQTTLSYHPEKDIFVRQELTDTEIESLPTDGKYESEFERESATESAIESSIMDMSANESNLNFSYSTVGMVDRMIYSQEMKGEQLAAIIESKAKSMIDRLKGQISFLEVKKQRCKGNGQVAEMQSIKKKQRAILMKLHEARTTLKKIVESESAHKILGQPQQSSKYPNLYEKILKSRLKVPLAALGKSKPVKGFEIEPSFVLERLLKKRQKELEARKKKLQELSEWQLQLDEEERRVIKMEEQLLQQNIAEAQNTLRQNVDSPKSVKSLSISDRKPTPSVVEDDSRIAERLCQIENSLSLLQDVRDDADDNVVLTGLQLNKLWFRLSGRKEKKFDQNLVYDLNKKKVAELYEEAKNVVLSQFEDKNRVKQLLEASKMQESFVENAHESVPESPNDTNNGAGSSTTEASSVLDKDENDVPEIFSVPEVSNVTPTDEIIPKMESFDKVEEEVEELEEIKSVNTPISIEVEEDIAAIDEEKDPEPEVSYSDTFNHSLFEPDETQYLDNTSFPKFETFHNNDETFIEKSFENERQEEIPEEASEANNDHPDEKSSTKEEIVEEVLTIAHSATSSSSSSISSKIDTESDEMLIMAAISTITVTPKIPASPVDYKLPDIINEAEVLRRQQMQIEQEIEQLQQQVPFVYLRDIPNKPPPPYTLPLQESKNKFPSLTTINALVTKRVENLYKLNRKSSATEEALQEDDTLNIYERLIIDVSDEFFYTFDRQNGVVKNSLIFYNPPSELECLQNFIANKVEKICDPLTRDDSLTMSSLDDFAPLNAYYNGRRNHKKDLVDEILMQELIEDDPNWTYFEEEETIVKNDLINGILKMIVDEAVTELLQIIT